MEVKHRQHVWKNVGFTLAVLFLWASARFLYARVFGGASHVSGFVRFDILFVFLPPLAAFFLNWHWMRNERTDTIIKWSAGWSAIDAVIFLLTIYFAGDPLHQLFRQMQT